MSLGACNLLTCPAVVISKELYIFHVQQVVLIRFVTQSNLNFRICCLPTNLHQIAQNYTRTEQWSEKKQSTWADGIVALVFSTQSGSARDNCLLSNELLTAKRLPIVNDISSSTSLLGFFATNNNFWGWRAIYEAQQIVGNSWEIMMVLLLLGENKDDKWKLRLVSHERLILDSRQVVENFYISYLWQNVFLCLCQKYLCGKRSQRVVWWL